MFSGENGRLQINDDATLLILREPNPAPATGPGTPNGRTVRLIFSPHMTTEYVSLPCQCLLKYWIGSQAFYVRAPLGDWPESGHLILASTWSPWTSVPIVSIDTALTHPIPPICRPRLASRLESIISTLFQSSPPSFLGLFLPVRRHVGRFGGRSIDRRQRRFLGYHVHPSSQMPY